MVPAPHLAARSNVIPKIDGPPQALTCRSVRITTGDAVIFHVGSHDRLAVCLPDLRLRYVGHVVGHVDLSRIVNTGERVVGAVCESVAHLEAVHASPAALEKRD